MKKFTLLTIAALTSIVAFAQKPRPFLNANTIPSEQTQFKVKAVSRQLAARKAKRRSMGLVTPPESAVRETYYTAKGKLMVNTSNGFADGGRETIQVIVDGTDIYIAGLAYWVENAWIKGTIGGTTATFPAAQQVDDNENAPEWISGSDDGETICDIVFNFDQEAGVLECVTQYIVESAYEDEIGAYAYWDKPTFTKDQPVAPEVVVPPTGLETEDYVIIYSDNGSASVKVGFDGNDVYFQGLNSYLPEAWVKGTLADGLVTLAGGQYFGAYGIYEMYFMDEDYQFTYDAETDTFVGEGILYTYTGNQNVDSYANPVIKKVVEQAAMPANPEITRLEDSNFGYIVKFNIPLIDVNGDPLVTSKLWYVIYADTEGTIAPLTFTPETHSRLTEDMTEIPYGFTDNYDFYPTFIYLNDLYSANWTRIGIQSIYRGGGEENATKIQWYELKANLPVPVGVEAEEYTMFYEDISENPAAKTVNVAVDGNDVYFQGFSEYIPEAWVKGTKDGNTVTFAAKQLFGEYKGYKSYAFYGTDDVVFTYDAEADTYSAEGWIYGLLAGKYYDGYYVNPVIKKIADKAAMPAAPEITDMANGSYGWYIDFNVPIVDVNGEPLVLGKLSYMIYTDTEGTVAPLTFTPTTHSKLTEDMTEIPYRFTENNDFYIDKIYLNDLYSADWTRIGIQSIYRGGGEENKTEIQWFDILPEPEAIEAPEGLVTETYALNANEWVERSDVPSQTRRKKSPSKAMVSQPYNFQMQVGFNGNDVYFKGVSDNTADLWLKGTLSPDGKTVTIPANQYMGQINLYGIITYDYFFSALGEDNKTLEDIVLNYNAGLGTFTTDQTLVLHDGKRSLGEPYQIFTDVVITKMLEFAATPADPSIDSYKLENIDYPYIEFNIPAKDIDDNDIISAKLFYTVWIDEDGEEKPFVVLADEYRDVTEDWTEIPYEWEDNYDIYKGGSRFYINPRDIIPSWKRIGIQSIYYGGGERNTSNIVWMDNPAYSPVDEAYELYVGSNVQVTSKNLSDILGDGGTLTYNRHTRTLTINAGCTSDAWTLIRNTGVEDLTIYVAKDAELSGSSPDFLIYLGQSTTITGPGKLTLNGNIAVIDGKQLTIKDANIEIPRTTSYAITGNFDGEKLLISNSYIHAQSYSQSIAKFDGGITIKDDSMLEDGLRISDDKSCICKMDGTDANDVTIYNQEYITGMSFAPALPAEVEIYNLAGQRLQKMQRGINIVGGRKVVVK